MNHFYYLLCCVLISSTCKYIKSGIQNAISYLCYPLLQNNQINEFWKDTQSVQNILDPVESASSEESPEEESEEEVDIEELSTGKSWAKKYYLISVNKIKRFLSNS